MSHRYWLQYWATSAAILAVNSVLLTIDWAASSVLGGQSASLTTALKEALIGAIAAGLVADVLMWIVRGASDGSSLLFWMLAICVQVIATTGTWTVAADGTLNPGDANSPVMSWVLLIITTPLVVIRLRALRLATRKSEDDG